ncbi:MAG: diacylglycerol kinase family lipid kinase [Rhizobiaceae bacterium]|nr:diacylglycerol kinase family lipid kinase [Rhizobiaceae bacterium]
MRVGVVVNPVAGGGRMRALWPEIHAMLADRFDGVVVRETRGPGEGADVARDLALDGLPLVVAAGGDGTVSETVDGLLQARRERGSTAELGIMPVGTGSDLARGLGIAGEPKALVARIAESKARAIDAGRVSFVDDNGALAARHFINIASLGVSGPTDRAVNAAKSGGRMSGKMVFLWHTVRELIRYRFQQVRVTVDDGNPLEATIALVAAANGRFFGGGMMIAPDAAIDDGQLEVIVVRGASKLKLVSDLRLVYSGAHRSLASCTFLRGQKVVVEPLGDPIANGALLDIDGESPGRIPATFEILPGAIRVRS